jgi:hypothetical protein
LYLRDDHGFGISGGAGAAAAVRIPAACARAIAIDRGARPKSLREVDLVVDLGAGLGTARWYRGLATLGALIVAAVRVAAPFHSMALPIAPTLSHARHVQMTVQPRSAAPIKAALEPAQLDLDATMERGDHLARILERQGVTHEDAVQAARLVSGVMPPSDIAPGTRLAITLGRRPNQQVARPLDALSFRARFDLALSLKRVNGALTLERRSIAIDSTPMRLTGTVGAGLYASARAAGVPVPLIADYIRVIARHIDIGTIAPSDSFDLIFEHKRAATGEEQTGRLLYAGLLHGKQMLMLAPWTYAGRTQWFDASGVGDRHDGFTVPVAGARLSSSFGMRFHPILGFSRMHQGVDLAAPYGTPIVAASSGVVRFAGWHGGHGNFVQIVHAGGMGTGYGHMSQFVVHPGEAVQQGQLIGYVGSTGLSTGPHCHFEVYRDGAAIDPTTASFETAEQLDGPAFGQFRAKMMRLTSLPFGGARANGSSGN